jgi:hypothetical protein
MSLSGRNRQMGDKTNESRVWLMFFALIITVVHHSFAASTLWKVETVIGDAL